DGQTQERHRADENGDDGDDHRDDWTTDEEFRHGVPQRSLAGAAGLLAAGAGAGAAAARRGSPTVPSLTRCRPATITLSPPSRPLCTTRTPSAAGPSSTVRRATFLSGPTTATE